MLRKILAASAAIAMLSGAAAPVEAAACRDAKGKFMKCAPKAPVKCRDAKGHFAKCGTPGAKPA